MCKNFHIAKLVNKKKRNYVENFQKTNSFPYTLLFGGLKWLTFKGDFQNCTSSVPFSASPSVSKVGSVQWEGWSRSDCQDRTILHSISLIRKISLFLLYEFHISWWFWLGLGWTHFLFSRVAMKDTRLNLDLRNMPEIL